MGVVVRLTAKSGAKQTLVQILVVLENIQIRTFKTELGRVTREQKLDVG